LSWSLGVSGLAAHALSTPRPENQRNVCFSCVRGCARRRYCSAHMKRRCNKSSIEISRAAGSPRPGEPPGPSCAIPSPAGPDRGGAGSMADAPQPRGDHGTSSVRPAQDPVHSASVSSLRPCGSGRPAAPPCRRTGLERSVLSHRRNLNIGMDVHTDTVRGSHKRCCRTPRRAAGRAIRASSTTRW